MLYIIYVDFSKAYDRVPRNALIEALKTLGCGVTMVLAVGAMYSNTQLILGTAIITAAIGVRQGSPTSCFLFTLYVNKLIELLRSRCPNDGFLGWIHCLLLMDDTVIFATTRDKATRKVGVLVDFCEEAGMVINEEKTKFMVINGSPDDLRPIYNRNLAIHNCEKYIYLGATFTQDGKIQSSIKAHCKMKACHALKFKSFVSKNNDFPFWVKRTVMDAALLSSVFYGCEAWLCKQQQDPGQLYTSAIKSLLSVRRTTPNDLCLVEIGYPTVVGYVRGIQHSFYSNIIRSRKDMTDDPFWVVWTMVNEANTPCAKYINQLLNEDDPRAGDLRKLKHRIRASDATKPSTYRTDMNPELEVHTAYTT